MDQVRFDDRLSTILVQPYASEAARAILWQQIVDQLAQDTSQQTTREIQRAWQLAYELRGSVPLLNRRQMADALATLCVSAKMVMLFATDVPFVAAPMILKSGLSERDWMTLLPQLPVSARALLRERRDLTEPLVRALQSFGRQDFLLMDQRPLRHGLVDQPHSASGEYANLTEADIAKNADMEADDEIVSGPPIINNFRFATETTGRIFAVLDAPAAPLIGLDISRIAEIGCAGVDGFAAGAFRSRAAYREAHMLVLGSGPVAGDWLIACVPRFSENTGRFLGYLGYARRPRRPDQFRGGGINSADLMRLSDGLRHFLHEVRTPLNAIGGFAEIMSAQLYGPVGAKYRTRAAAIVAWVGQVSDVLEDVQLFGKLGEEKAEAAIEANIALARLIAELLAETEEFPGKAQSQFSYRAEANVPVFVGNVGLVKKMVRRLFQSISAVAQPEERIETRLLVRGNTIILSMARPLSLSNLDDARLFDVGITGISGGGALPLGFGFSIRLVRALADYLGVRFEMSRQSLSLRFPTVQSFSDR